MAQAANDQDSALYAEALGAAVKAVRIQKGLSASEVARRARISYSTLHHIERGRAPDFKTLIALAVAMGVTVSEFVTAADGEQSTQRQVSRPVTREPVERWGVEGGKGLSVSEAQTAFLDHLGWAMLKAARSTNRGLTQAVLEELAVAFGLAIDKDAGEETKRAVVKQRRIG